MKRLIVGRESAGFIERGHPWIRPDRFTIGLETLVPGEPVVLGDERGRTLAAALADPTSPVCARVYSRDPNLAYDPASAVRKAWAKRGRFHHDRHTDCYRVVHGEADGLPGLRIERYADVLVVLVLADCAATAIEPICATLAELLPQARIVVREHRDDLRREAVATRFIGGDCPGPETLVEAREFGVILPLRPFAGLATGIYVDQRGTRRWLRPQIAGKRVLNLFAYTGIFSLSLLQAGAASAIDVDLAAPALARAQEAAERNALTDRYRQHQSDCLEFLAADTGHYDVIISDPPTAAQGGESGWISRRDYPRLLSLVQPRLAPGGLLIACSNTIGGKAIEVDGLIREAQLPLAILPAPELDPDIPQVKGFPEGRPFRLVVAQQLRP